jgi:hypothetical protein
MHTVWEELEFLWTPTQGIGLVRMNMVCIGHAKVGRECGVPVLQNETFPEENGYMHMKSFIWF